MINCSCKWGKPWSPAYNMRPSIKAVALCLLARFRPSRSRIGQGTSEPTNACINVNAALSAEKGSPPCRATPWKLISLNGTEAWSQVPVADVAGRFCLTFRALRSTRHVKRMIEAPGFSNHDKAVRMQDATGVAPLEYHPTGSTLWHFKHHHNSQAGWTYKNISNHHLVYSNQPLDFRIRKKSFFVREVYTKPGFPFYIYIIYININI